MTTLLTSMGLDRAETHVAFAYVEHDATTNRAVKSWVKVWDLG